MRKLIETSEGADASATSVDTLPELCTAGSCFEVSFAGLQNPRPNFPRGSWRYSHGLLSGRARLTHTSSQCCADWPVMLLA